MPGSIDRRLLFGFLPTWSTDVNNPAPNYDADMATKMAGAHTQCARFSFNWDVIEPNAPVGGQHTYLWASFDAKVTLLTAHSIEPIGLIVGTPNWANPGNPAAPAFKLPDEAHQVDLSAFCQALASRYTGSVRYYEFWNEPSTGMSFDVNEYTKWLGRARQALTSPSGNPAAQVSLGGLDISSTANGDYQPDPARTRTDYLQGVYDYIQGQGQSPDAYFDAIALHPYEYQPRFLGIPPINIDGVEAHWQLMLSKGDGEKTVWVTEYGWDMNRFGTDEQAAWLVEALDLLAAGQRTYLVIATMHLFADHDLPAPLHYGVCYSNLTERPAYGAFRDYAAPRTPTWESKAPFVTLV